MDPVTEKPPEAPKKSGRGGARPNSGGRRPGAGRPKGSAADRAARAAKKAAQAGEQVAPALPPTQPGHIDSLTYLRQVVNDPTVTDAIRVRAASKLAEFEFAKPGDKGKKEQREDEAGKVADSSRFGGRVTPLRAVK